MQTDGAHQDFDLPFTVDSALLRELGERLVGRPHIALAELVKNSFDADARTATISFDEDEIIVVDDGHGMDFVTFRDHWMRIGSPHKAAQRVSRKLGRPLTGSKGVGRLAAQFLAHEIELVTVPTGRREQVRAQINWDDAVSSGELTEATAALRIEAAEARFVGQAGHGVRITMRGLKQEWGSEDLQQLAAELWPLQPPFHSRKREADAFVVRLRTEDHEAQAQFEFQMTAVLELWVGRVTGRLADGVLDVAVQFSDEDKVHPLHLEDVPEHLDACDFEIRVFNLRYRQPYGIAVDDARNYLNRFGGVHVYDAGFHLPHYGVDTDWLNVEQDHAHRLSLSRLLPRELQVERGLNYLPTNSRLYGVVNVNTSREHARGERRADDDTNLLTIQISRDRLIDNAAYHELRRVVRSSLDYYAILEAQRAQRRIVAGGMGELPAPVRLQRVEDVLEAHRSEIPASVFEQLEEEISQALRAVQAQADAASSQATVLAALATAGIGAVAYQHEFSRQLSNLDRLAQQLRRASTKRDFHAVRELTDDVRQAVRDARASRDLFTHLLDEEDRVEVARYRARAVLDSVAHQLRYFLRGVVVDHEGVTDELRLPPGRMADWSALFQNVYTNAVNAMLDSDLRVIAAHSEEDAHRQHLVLQDTGAGVDVAEAEELFEPFERRLELSADRRALGIGGTGLGLTIVRMIATSLRCDVAFVQPDDGYSTALRISWSKT